MNLVFICYNINHNPSKKNDVTGPINFYKKKKWCFLWLLFCFTKSKLYFVEKICVVNSFYIAISRIIFEERSCFFEGFIGKKLQNIQNLFNAFL